MPDPALVVTPDADWEATLAAHGITPRTVAYWRIFGTPPRAFYSRKVNKVFVEMSSCDNEKLLAHEYAHAIKYADHDHPHGIAAGIRHAIRVGFDCRAFTGLLRWRFGPADLKKKYAAWRLALARL